MTAALLTVFLVHFILAVPVAFPFILALSFWFFPSHPFAFRQLFCCFSLGSSIKRSSSDDDSESITTFLLLEAHFEGLATADVLALDLCSSWRGQQRGCNDDHTVVKLSSSRRLQRCFHYSELRKSTPAIARGLHNKVIICLIALVVGGACKRSQPTITATSLACKAMCKRLRCFLQRV